MSDHSQGMNRRMFLIRACQALGGCGIAGMLLAPSQRGSPPSSEIPPAPAPAYDLSVAKAEFLRVEAAGFPPRDAQFWEKMSSGLIRCTLCPTYCELRPYQRGNCRVRFSLENRLVTVVYGKPCSVAIDPIEKKPVFHLLPGTTAFSLATAGCLLGCRYCQNWQISQARPEECEHHDLPPEEAVQAALSEGCRSLAYTYTEPTIFYEYMFDTARLAQARGLRNVMVSCGYINPEPLKQLLPYLDVMKVDLKGFTERFYQTVCGGTLAPVLKTLQTLAGSKTLIDIVTLVVPTLNDDPETMKSMFRWIHANLGPDASLYLSRFFPTYQLRNLPSTPVENLLQLRTIAQAEGLNYVYLGNMPGSEGENTYCPKCHQVVIGRVGYSITENHLQNGHCASCGTPIPGIWE